MIRREAVFFCWEGLFLRVVEGGVFERCMGCFGGTGCSKGIGMF